MNKLLLLTLGVLMTGLINSQVILNGISPASIAGTYEITYNNATSSGSWNGIDIELPANSIQDTLVKFLPADACASSTNAADVDGHIAVVYRGGCEFGLKVANAEAAGAIAVIVINNAPGELINMGAGDNGGTTTIPSVMVSDIDGAELVAAMDDGPVVVFIGDKNGKYENDVGMKISSILRPKYSAIPSAIANNSTEFKFDVGAKVFTFGSEDQTGIKLQAIVKYEGDVIYDHTSDPVDILPGDSAIINLPEFAPGTLDEGSYTMRYILTSDETDEYPSDNEFESDFVISDYTLTYASYVDSLNRTNSTGGSRPIDQQGNPIAHFSSCIHFKDENASRLAPKSISFAASKSVDAADTSFFGESVLISVYEYNDNFARYTDAGFKNPIENYNELMLGEFEYTTEYNGDFITAEFAENEIVGLYDNQRYMFCVTTFNEGIFFGTDNKRDYTINREHYGQPVFITEAGTGKYNPNGFGAGTVPTLMVTFMDAAQVNLKNEKLALNMNAYPSPASDLLNVDFKQNEVNKVELVNMMGQTVVAQNVSHNAETTTLDVAGVENGVYIVKVYLTNNMTHTMQVVINH